MSSSHRNPISRVSRVSGPSRKSIHKPEQTEDNNSLSDEEIAIIISRLQSELYSWTATTFILYTAAVFLAHPSLIGNIQERKIKYVSFLVIFLLVIIIYFLIIALADYYQRRNSLIERDIAVPARLDALGLGLVAFLIMVLITIYVISI